MAHQPPPGGLQYANYSYQQPMAPQNGTQQQHQPPYSTMNGQIPQAKPQMQPMQYPSQQPMMPAANQPPINYQNFQTKAVPPALNGSSSLSSRTSSPGIAAVPPPSSSQAVIPPSQLPPTMAAPARAYQQFAPGSSQLPPMMSNNNNPPMSTPTQPQQLSASMKNLTMNSGPMMPPQQQQQQQPMMNQLPSSKSDQNFLNNNNGTNGNSGAIPPMNIAMMPPKMNSTSNLSQLPSRPAYPQAPSGLQSPTGGGVAMMPPQSQPTFQQPAQFAAHQQQQQPQRQNLQYQNLNQYPQQMQQQQQQPAQQMNYPGSIVQQGFSKMWGRESVDLLQQRHILPTTKVLPPPIKLNNMFHDATNCSPDIFRCTLTKIPESNALLQKSRLPLGVLIHPYRDLSNLPVISCTTIVRCRVCRTYINPFVFFVDSKKWKCNLCYRVNELPEEFQYDPVSKTYGDPTRRPEIRSSTIEFIAPSEYMLRPPQPAVYLFLLDVSSLAQQSGYLDVACATIFEQLDNLPGDARTQVGFVAYNSAVHFYSMAEGYNQPHEITVLEVDDVFLPCPDNLLVNLKECRELIGDLLQQLPKRFANQHDNKSALGAALQVAYKLMLSTGGRVTVFQTCLPNCGPGSLQSREDPNNRSSKDVQHLGPATDFYKRLALDCSGVQMAVDLFLLNSQYSDLATLSGISKFSGGSIQHFPLFNSSKQQQVTEFQRVLVRYLTRKVGFESVMRVRCTRGLTIHTFHGNFFVRSTDLLSLPNVNPDAGFAMQINYEESLADVKTVCFQAALLYTSSKAERRIRVHTLCLPVTESLSEVVNSADQQCIAGLLAKMAVDRSLSSNLSDARDAFINATVDVLSSYKLAMNLPSGTSALVTPTNMSLYPLYILALLKSTAFRTGTSTRLDDRVFSMCQMKALPLDQMMRYIYPDFYLLDSLFASDEGDRVDPPRLQLSAERLDSRSMFLMDNGSNMLIYVGSNTNPSIIKNVFGLNSVNEIPELCYNLPKLETPSSEALHEFIDSVNEEKPFNPTIQIIRDSSPARNLIVQHLVDDRSENSLSYYEFLQHLRSQVSK